VHCKQPVTVHLEELRYRLLYCFLAVTVTSMASYLIADKIYALLTYPLINALLARGQDSSLQYTQLYETFMTYVKLSIFSGLFVSAPFILFHLWSFVSPGLFRNERKSFIFILILSPCLFLIGASLVYFVALPIAIHFFLDFQTVHAATGSIDIVFDGKVNEYLSLVMMLILGFGISFQLPLLLTFLCRIGVLSAEMLARKRRHALVAILLCAALVTPPDIISQFSLGIPLYMLYEVSLFIARRYNKKQTQELKNI